MYACIYGCMCVFLYVCMYRAVVCPENWGGGGVHKVIFKYVITKTINLIFIEVTLMENIGGVGGGGHEPPGP